MKRTAMNIPVGMLAGAAWNTHGEACINGDEAKALAESIATNGIIQRLTVRRVGEVYELVDGHRRLAAAKMAGLADVPCDVLAGEVTDEDARVMMAAANIQRLENDPILEAELIERMEDDGRTKEDIAGLLGKSVGYVYRRARLISLVQDWRDAARENGFGVGLMESIASHERGLQQEVFDRFADNGGLEDVEAAEILRAFERSMMKLSSAAFDTSKCVNCPNNTACHAMLFPDMEDGGDARCQDRECFVRKSAERVDAVVMEAREKGMKVVEVASRWEIPDSWSSTENPTDTNCVGYVFLDQGVKSIRWSIQKGARKAAERNAMTKEEREAEKARKAAEKARKAVLASGREKLRAIFKDVESAGEFIEEVVTTEAFRDWAKAFLRKRYAEATYVYDDYLDDLIRMMPDDGVSKYCPTLTDKEREAIVG